MIRFALMAFIRIEFSFANRLCDARDIVERARSSSAAARYAQNGESALDANARLLSGRR